MSIHTKHMHVRGLERLKAAIGYVPTQAEREQRQRELYVAVADLDRDMDDVGADAYEQSERPSRWEQL